MHLLTRFSALVATSILPCCAGGTAATASDFPAATTADALFAEGDFPAASTAYERELATTPNDVDANIGAARLDLYSCRFAEARARARTVLAADPSNETAAHLLAEIGTSEALATAPDVAPAQGEVDIPFLQTDPLPMVALTINGHAAHVILDTGGPGLDLSDTFATTAGIAETAAQSAEFAGGRAAAVRSGGIVRTVRIGWLALRDVPAGVAPVPPGVDGVLGTTFFERFLTTIDYVHGRLILRAKSRSAAFETAAAARGDSIVPMYLVPDHYLFAPAHVNDAPEALFNIDTGGGPMVGVDLTTASLEAAHIVPDAAHSFPFMGGGGPVRAQPFTASSVTLGHTIVKDVPGVYVPSSGTHRGPPFTPAGRISHAFFRHAELTFDFKAMKLIVSPGGAPR